MTQTAKTMPVDHLAAQLARVQKELLQAREVAEKTQADAPAHVVDHLLDETTLVETLSQLSIALEELQVAQEEIQQQNEEMQVILTTIKEERLRYQALFDFAPEAYLVTDINGIIQEANHATAELLDMPAQHLTGKPLAVFVARESKQAFYRLMVTARDIKTRKMDEFLLKPLHHQEIVAEFTVLTTRNEDNLPTSQRWLIRDISHRKQIEGELEQSRTQLQTFASNIQSAREDERARVAREIHDELGQTLTALRLDVGMLKKQVPDAMGEVHRRLDLISGTVISTIQTVRRIMTDLRPSVLDEAGLIAAMEWQCRDFRARTGIHCRFLTKETQLDLDEESTNAIFRLTQEMLTNAAKHSEASRVTVELKQGAKWVQLEVRDNGRGITEVEINNPVTAGLLGMRERVRLLNGEITFQGVPNRGTRIRVRLLRESVRREAEQDAQV